MLFNFEDKQNNFEFVDIPSNRKLFEQMGFSRDELHPDGQDANTFAIPENVVGSYPSEFAREVVESDMRNHMSGKDVIETIDPSNSDDNDRHE